MKTTNINKWIIVIIILFPGKNGILSSKEIQKGSVNKADVVLVNKNYNRQSSRVLIRRIIKPTRANLDFAARDD